MRVLAKRVNMCKPFPSLENETRLVLYNIKPNQSLRPVKKFLLQTLALPWEPSALQKS